MRFSFVSRLFLSRTPEIATVVGEPQKPQGFRQTSGEIINEKLFIKWKIIFFEENFVNNVNLTRSSIAFQPYLFLNLRVSLKSPFPNFQTSPNEDIFRMSIFYQSRVFPLTNYKLIIYFD